MTWRRQLLFAFIVPIGTVVLVLLLAEIVLRFLPVSTGLHTMPVNAQNPIFHFQPDRSFVHSNGWDMHRVVRGRINNAGFVNDQDYRREDALPLLAVVGDSYIEAQMVPYSETMQGRLARQFADKLRVYSFAGSGAPLSQYLIWAGSAVHEYDARAVVINVVGNDFDESLRSYKFGPGFWLYSLDADGTLQLRLVDYRPGWAIAVARHSALFRYLIMNLHANVAIFALRSLREKLFGIGANAAPRFTGAIDAATATPRVRDSLAAIDAFFRDIPKKVGLPPRDILFTVDGYRYPESIKSGRGSYFDLMRRAFMQKAAALGYEAIDLETWFAQRYERTSEHFEFPDDGHWNGNGHAVAEKAVASSKLLKSLVH